MAKSVGHVAVPTDFLDSNCVCSVVRAAEGALVFGTEPLRSAPWRWWSVTCSMAAAICDEGALGADARCGVVLDVAMGVGCGCPREYRRGVWRDLDFDDVGLA
jgi:hypothetical protein